MGILEWLDKDVSCLLEAEPFKNWLVEKFVEVGLGERRIHYVFKGHGLELRCDKNDKINVIFLKSADNNHSAETLFEIPFSSNRERVLKHFGSPSKSGEKT